MNTSYQKLVTKEQVSFTELVEHQESVVLDLESLNYYSLNAAATLLWKRLRAGATVEELGGALSAAFGLSSTHAAADAAGFIELLRENRLVRGTDGEVPAPAAAFEPPAAQAPLGYEAPALRISADLMDMRLAISGTI